MPAENSVLTEYNENSCQGTSPAALTYRSMSKTEEKAEFSCCNGYDATYCWNQYEISPSNKLNFSILSTRQTTLPPLASVFSNNSINFSTSLQNAEEKLEEVFQQNTDQKSETELFSVPEHKNGPQTLFDPEQVLSGTMFNAMHFPNPFLHRPYEKNDKSLSTEQSRLSRRKRPYSSTVRDFLPPNVNTAFKKLRNLIPTEPADRRLSKVETLRLAVSYIQHLGKTLNADHWVEQPCLVNKVIKATDDQNSSSICTFCMSKNRKLCVNAR